MVCYRKIEREMNSKIEKDKENGSWPIGKRMIGKGCPAFVIAEVAQAHDGSLGTAHAFIDAAAKAGADAIKFQTHIADAESSPHETFRVKFSQQDASRYDYWKRMEFTADQWQGLAQHASDVGVIFLSTPFSIEAIDLLKKIGVSAWKIGSGDVGNLPFLSYMLETELPVLLSSGMSSWDELDKSINCIRAAGVPFMLYQCTTKYPCPAEDVGLPLLHDMRDRYGCPVGLSDHSGTIFPGIAAAALGAASVEIHITMSHDAFGPDVSSSLTPEELREMVQGIRFVEASLHAKNDKNAMAHDLADTKSLFSRSIVVTSEIKPGEVLTSGCLSLKKPGGGLGSDSWLHVLGCKAKTAMSVGHFLGEDDFECGSQG